MRVVSAPGRRGPMRGVTQVCALETCGRAFTPWRLPPHHQYCSERCSKRAYRASHPRRRAGASPRPRNGHTVVAVPVPGFALVDTLAASLSPVNGTPVVVWNGAMVRAGSRGGLIAGVTA